MRRPRIVIADVDYNYIIPLQLKFVEDMFDQIDLEIITEEDYFEEIMSIPQAIDILIVSEDLYSDRLLKHDIKYGFVMKESEEDIEEKSRFTYIYKYKSIKEIFAVIIGKTNGLTLSNNKQDNTQLILVTSATGGVGKTTLAMGVAAVLSKHLKKVLYINIDYMQNFQSYLNDKTPITDNGIYMRMAGNAGDGYALISHLIRNEGFDYIPPFKGALLSLGIGHSASVEIMKQAIESKQYDYIVVDADSTFDADKMKMLAMADKMIFVTTQTEVSVLAMNRFLENIDVQNKEKILFVCNQYDPNKKDAIKSGEFEMSYGINEYVGFMPEHWKRRTDKFASDVGIQKIVLSIM